MGVSLNSYMRDGRRDLFCEVGASDGDGSLDCGARAGLNLAHSTR